MDKRKLSALTAAAVAVVSAVLLGSTTFAIGQGHRRQVGAAHVRHGTAPPTLTSLEGAAAQPASLQGSLGTQGLVGFGLAFGVAFAAMTRSVTRVSRRAAGIEVAEKTETKPAAYLDNIPRSLVDKKTLDKILAVTPKEQWDDPPEESTLYLLKTISETYGPGKATKMRFSDFAYLNNQILPRGPEQVIDEYTDYRTDKEFMKATLEGKIPLQIPGPSGYWDAGVWLDWKGPEPFAGDQVKILVRDSGFSRQFLDNLAFYRQGLKPWQRGLEIGMAHGYFIIGPFVSLGPLRNTPEAATVGLLAGVAVIFAATVGGLLFGTTLKPTILDSPGDKPAAGWQEMMAWHAVGGTGGAAFAHVLLTLFAL